MIRSRWMHTLKFVIFGSLLLSGCSDDDIRPYPNPDLSFAFGQGYTVSDTSLLLNGSITIGLEASSNSEVNLTHLHTCIDADGEITRMDSGFNVPSLRITKTLTKGLAEVEKWAFYVRDKEGRKSDSLSIILTLEEGTQYGPVVRLPAKQLGAQENTELGGFLGLPSGKVLTRDAAAASQGDIWLLYYYDNVDADKHTIASPGANIPSSLYDLSGWTVRNTTRFQPVEGIDEEVFASASHDSLILSNSFEFGTGKRKAKKLSAGDMYSFVTENGLRGMIRVNVVDGTVSGYAECEIIIQDL
jgi:hypothetical protein